MGPREEQVRERWHRDAEIARGLGLVPMGGGSVDELAYAQLADAGGEEAAWEQFYEDSAALDYELAEAYAATPVAYHEGFGEGVEAVTSRVVQRSPKITVVPLADYRAGERHSALRVLGYIDGVTLYS